MTISIRKSTKNDRDIIIKVADLAFEKSKDESFEFRYPMLFDDFLVWFQHINLLKQ